MANNLLREHFYFTRHGQTDWNAQKLCQGHRDIPLNEKGLLEAKTLAAKQRHLEIPCIVSSSLTRALQTAKVIRETHPKAALHIVPELSERGWGSLEGISSEEMYAIEELEEQDPLYNPGRGVEERHAFRSRVLRAIHLAQNHHPHPFIVSHGRVFMELCFILRIAPIRQIPGCQTFEVKPTSDSWIITPLEK